MNQAERALKRVDRNLSPTNLNVVNHHRSLLRRFRQQAERADGVEYPERTKVGIRTISQQVEDFCHVPYYGLERRLVAHSKSSVLLIGEKDYQSLETLTGRIFSYLRLDEAIRIWLGALIRKKQSQACAIAPELLAMEWQSLLERIGTGRNIDRRAFDSHWFACGLRRASTLHCCAGHLDPQAGLESLLTELELRNAGRQYVAIGRYC